MVQRKKSPLNTSKCIHQNGPFSPSQTKPPGSRSSAERWMVGHPIQSLGSPWQPSFRLPAGYSVDPIDIPFYKDQVYMHIRKSLISWLIFFKNNSPYNLGRYIIPYIYIANHQGIGLFMPNQPMVNKP